MKICPTNRPLELFKLLGINFCPLLNKPQKRFQRLRFGQSGEIWPNLVALNIFWEENRNKGEREKRNEFKKELKRDRKS